MKRLLFSSLLLIPLLGSCVGVRSTDDNYTVHAETFHLFGLEIPGNDHDAAWAKVPAGAEVHTVRSTPSDWTSVFGILTNILGFSSTEISWKGGAPVEAE